MKQPVDWLPTEPGAYVLVIALETALDIDIPAFAGRSLGPGLYAYCGSAYGPGGLRARIARHLRRDKASRWHVDRLTAAGRVESVALRIGGRECDLVAELRAAGAAVPLPGFGSSDCRACPAHLLALPAGAGTLPLEDVMSFGRNETRPV